VRELDVDQPSGQRRLPSREMGVPVSSSCGLNSRMPPNEHPNCGRFGPPHRDGSVAGPSSIAFSIALLRP